MTLLKQIDTAVSFLRESGAYRFGGLWLDGDGNPLDGDPIEAAKALRHRTIRKVVEAKRASGEAFTR